LRKIMIKRINKEKNIFRVLKLSQNALLSLLLLSRDLHRKKLFVFQHIHVFQIKKVKKKKMKVY
jgi:hypothetical protein